jgi:heme-degrading monooxygenase HmoA
LFRRRLRRDIVEPGTTTSGASNREVCYSCGQRQAIAQEISMFIAMNRFRVAKGSEPDFEQVWLSRDSHLDKVPGFVEFHLLKGPEAEDHTLYASHTIWASKAAFEEWTRSEAFRAAHKGAGDNKPLYLGHPQFEGFEVRQTVKK